eukprot:10890655-Ditylum_brightwellii.AAC.1
MRVASSDDLKDVSSIEVDCWSHLRNVWLGGVIKLLNTHLNSMLKDELDSIKPRLQVMTGMDLV